MQTATQYQSDDELRATGFLEAATVPRADLGTRSTGSDGFSFSGFHVPDSERALEAYETKVLARAIIQKRLKKGEREALLDERQRLLDKKFSGLLTKSDSNRLEYVRWSLDQIEDAQYGAALDVLESSVVRYENFLEGVEQLNRELGRNVRATRRR